MAAYSDVITQKSYTGMIGVTVEIPNFEFKNREMLRAFKRKLRLAHEQGINEGKDILKEVIRDRRAIASKRLFNSVARKLFVKTTDIFSGTIHFNNPGKEYAYFADQGRRAGLKPPYAIIKKYLQLKGRGKVSEQYIFNVRNKIAREGTKGHHFMGEAERRIQVNYQRIIDRAVDAFRRELK